MALYQVTSNIATVMNRASSFSRLLGTLSKGTQIDIISINSGWAYFKYKNSDAYTKSSNLTLVQTGSITIKYVDESTLTDIATAKVVSSLSLGTYSYTAITVTGYTLSSTSPQSVTLTSTNLNQVITFKYKKNATTGSVTIKYINDTTLTDIATSKVLSNLTLGTYSYTAITISGYNLSGDSTQSVTITASNPNQTITFKYTEILGSVIVKYLDATSLYEVLPTETFSNLKLGNYTYNYKSVDGYTLVGNTSQTITLTSTNPTQRVLFSYNQILGSVTVKYIDKDSGLDVLTPEVYSNLTLGSYNYTAKLLDNYTLSDDLVKTITLTSSTPTQTVTFSYSKVLGSVVINYIDNSTLAILSPSTTINNLVLGSYSYKSLSIEGYTVVGNTSQSVTLTKATPNITISFKYTKILGSVIINYVDSTTSAMLYPPTTINNLALGTYSYTAISLPGYTLVGDPTKSVTLSDSNLNQTIIFTYKEILGTINIKYIDNNTNLEIASAESYTNLKLGDYTYESKIISGYTVIGNSSKTVTLSEVNPVITIIFKYEEILGSITVSYVDENNTKITADKIDSKLKLGSYTYTAIDISGYSVTGDTTQSVILTSDTPNQSISFKYSKVVSDLYIIELEKFNIFNNNTEAVKTTKGINDALIYAKEQGYKKVQLPAGNYLIENETITRVIMTDKLDPNKTWTGALRGIIVSSTILLILTDCTLTLAPTKVSQGNIIALINANNSEIIGGTFIGDRHTHLFDLVINSDSTELESGDFDINTGLPIDDSTKMRTKNYITNLSSGSALPSSFVICPLANTSMNTVDGGCRYIYCYDKDNNYLGKPTGNNSFLTRATTPSGTTKIKISFRGEDRSDAMYFLTTESTYTTFETCTGVVLYGCDNVIIRDNIIKSFLGDGIGTTSPPINHSNNNLTISNCTLEDNRRQGMSFVGNSDGILIRDCKMGKTQGVDPQCGIDIEHYGYVKNVVIDNCDFYDNKKWDIINYNGCDIEIKNCRFSGGIGSTYGYNMNIHDNSFKYSDPSWLDKTFKGGLFALNTNKTDTDAAYFKIDNNTIEGYTSAGGNTTSSLSLSQFTNNKISNSSMVIGNNSYNNSYINSTIRYLLCSYVYSNETFDNCIIQGDNNGNNINSRYYDKFTMTNCDFKGGNNTVVNTLLTNCNIYNSTKPFCSIWSGKYTLDNCNITTEYTSNISFIPSQGIEGVTFTNCTLNLSVTPFIGLNYKSFFMNNCTIIFNKFYESSATVNFFKATSGVGYFDNNKFYKTFSSPLIVLPQSTNSTANNISFTNSITI